MRTIVLSAVAMIALAWSASAQMIASYTGGSGDPAAATGFTAMHSVLNDAPAVKMALAYVDSAQPMSKWVASSSYEAGNFANSPWAKNLIPLLGLPMAGAGQNGDEAFKAIADGSQDGVINAVFQAWADKGFEQFIIRPGFEMNGTWFSWSTNPGNVADFKAAFQHITALARNFQSAVITVCFNPNVGNTSVPLADLYPGNAAVDVIGLDTYGSPVNYDTSPSDSSTSPNDITLVSIMAFAKAQGKPFALPEIGSGRDDVTFPQQLLAVLKANKPAVLFAGFWDVDDSNGAMNWSSNPGSAASQAWAALARFISNGNPLPVPTLASVRASATAGTSSGASASTGSSSADQSSAAAQTPQASATDTASSNLPPDSGYVAWYPSSTTTTNQPATTAATATQSAAATTQAATDYLRDPSWWSANPEAQAAEAALCGSAENAGASRWLAYCSAAR